MHTCLRCGAEYETQCISCITLYDPFVEDAMHEAVYLHGLNAFRGGRSLKAVRSKLYKLVRNMVICASTDACGDIGVYVKGRVHYACVNDLWSEVDTRTGMRWKRINSESWESCQDAQSVRLLSNLVQWGCSHNEVILQTEEIVGMWYSKSCDKTTINIVECMAAEMGLPTLRVIEGRNQAALKAAIEKAGQ